MIPKIRVFAKAGVEAVYGGGCDRDQMFYEINYINFYDKEVSVWGCHNKDCGTCDDTYNFDDVEIMMSTGMKEKNGVDVFEGDYLSLISFEDNREYKGYVEFTRGSFCMVTRLKGYDYKMPINELLWIDESMEVLGNIYENPELLEVQE